MAGVIPCRSLGCSGKQEDAVVQYPVDDVQGENTGAVTTKADIMVMMWVYLTGVMVHEWKTYSLAQKCAGQLGIPFRFFEEWHTTIGGKQAVIPADVNQQKAREVYQAR